MTLGENADAGIKEKRADDGIKIHFTASKLNKITNIITVEHPLIDLHLLFLKLTLQKQLAIKPPVIKNACFKFQATL